MWPQQMTIVIQSFNIIGKRSIAIKSSCKIKSRRHFFFLQGFSDCRQSLPKFIACKYQGNFFFLNTAPNHGSLLKCVISCFCLIALCLQRCQQIN